MNSVAVSFIGFLGLLTGALSTYFVATKKMSGRVSSTEATELWNEARILREEGSVRIQRLEKKVEELEGKLARVIAENYELMSAKIDSERELKRLAKMNEDRITENERLSKLLISYQEERRKEKP